MGKPRLPFFYRIFPAFLLAAASAGAFAEDVDWAKRVEDARALEAAGKPAEALEAWKAIVLDLPAERAIEFRTAMDSAHAFLQSAGKYQEMEGLFRSASERRPADIIAASYLAMTLQLRSKFPEAEAVYRRITPAGGVTAAWASFNLGLILLREPAREMEAVDAFLASLRGNPTPAAADQADRIALIRVARRCFDDARRIWASIAETEGLEPAKRARALLMIEMIEYQQGRLDEAEALIRRAMEFSPGDPELPNNLALVLLSRGDEKGALEATGRALALDPAFADSLEVLGTFYFKRKQPEKAMEYYRRGHASAVAGLKKTTAAFEEGKRSKAPDLAQREYDWNRARYRLFRFETHLRGLAK